ncbi:unnamed protein product [Arctogadus glacialis]
MGTIDDARQPSPRDNLVPDPSPQTSLSLMPEDILTTPFNSTSTFIRSSQVRREQNTRVLQTCAGPFAGVFQYFFNLSLRLKNDLWKT